MIVYFITIMGTILVALAIAGTIIELGIDVAIKRWLRTIKRLIGRK